MVPCIPPVFHFHFSKKLIAYPVFYYFYVCIRLIAQYSSGVSYLLALTANFFN